MENISKEKFQIIGVDKNEGERIARPHISYMQDAWRRFRQNKTALIAFIILVAIIFMCVFGPAISGYAFEEVDKGAVNKAPSSEHWFGTDKLGRDVFTRTLYGGRLSMLIGLGSALIAAVIGVLLGCYGGYKGGIFDKVVLRLSEVFMSFPQLILVMMLGMIFGRGLGNLIFIFVLTGWGGVYRQARARMLSLREEEYVQSMKAFGINDFVIAYKHMLPNAIGPIVVNLTLSTAMFILDEAAMSFLGLGVPPEIATWGNILNAAQDVFTMQNYWWQWLPVGIVVSLFVISINCIGDGLRDSTDPTQMG